ncbi:uncharacterized protein LOC107039395 [Diachasma alloeum]|uniref:uncharacterized protein LOC107039395 n=1 Tax=Diachasma alloeum TaxID=454923 RepID=UPI000738397D|nr:uncharacterized protein LOC107039395 [Diachasma alloeum]
MKSFLTIVCLSMAVVAISAQDIAECLRQDSISCIQKSLYRKAKEFFGKDNLEIVNGVSLVKSADRSSRTGNEVFYDQEIEAASDVTERQSALESFVGEEASDFLTGRSLRINFAPAIQKIGESARAMVESVPEEVQQAADEVVEGRGKKKLLKSILPLLIAAKLKIGALATLAYFGIALLAKKALIASVISILISAFVGLRSLWSKGGHDVTGYNAGGWSSGNTGGWSAPASSGGWSSGGGGGGWEDGHGGYASAQSQAYSGYHH